MLLPFLLPLMSAAGHIGMTEQAAAAAAASPKPSIPAQAVALHNPLGRTSLRLWS